MEMESTKIISMTFSEPTPPPKRVAANLLYLVSAVAFVTIGGLGIAGVMSPTAVGASAIGLTVIPNAVHLKVLGPEYPNAVRASSLAWVVLGALTIGGILPSTILGYTMVTATVVPCACNLLC